MWAFFLIVICQYLFLWFGLVGPKCISRSCFFITATILVSVDVSLSARYHCQLALKQENELFFFLIWELLSYSNCKIHGITWVDLFFSVLVTEQALSTHKISPKLYQAQYPMSNRSLQPVFKKYGQEIGYLNCSFLAEPTQLLVILFLLYCLDPQLKGKNSHSIASINEREKMMLQGSKVLTPLQLSQNDLCTPLHLSQKMCWKLHSGLLCYGVGQEDSQL